MTQEDQARTFLRSGWLGTLAAMAFVALGTLAAVHWVQGGLGYVPFSDDATPRARQIAGERVNLPDNVIVDPDQRGSAALPSVEVALAYPGFLGFSQETRETFLQPDGLINLVRASLGQRRTSRDMDGRLEEIYLPLLEGEPRPGPAGLTLQRLASGIGYDGEELAIYAADDGLWVARCETAEKAGRARICLRDVFVGRNLALTYRFDARLLENWRDIERGMQETVAGWLR